VFPGTPIFKESMKKILLIVAVIFCISSCRSTEEAMQRTGFRPYAKGRDHSCQTRNFVGYGTYTPPRRRGVDR
jgi:hypothetical protein